MTLFIYNNKNGYNDYSEGIGIAEDIDVLWSGENWTQFATETGLDKEHIGGLLIQDGQLIFDAGLKQQNQESNLPLAYGKEMISAAEKAFLTQPWEIRKQLQLLFVGTGLKPILESETCNPMTQADFNSVITDLNNTEQLSEEQRQLFLMLIQEYAAMRRFTTL